MQMNTANFSSIDSTQNVAATSSSFKSIRNSHDNYNKWYVEPRYRILPKIVEEPYPFRNDDTYFYKDLYSKTSANDHSSPHAIALVLQKSP